MSLPAPVMPREPTVSHADALKTELLDQITEALAAQPRSLQKRIGPSEIGDPCDRFILHKLAGTPEPPRPPGWKPAIGTFAHDGLERIFDAANRGAAQRWVTERRVTVGHLPNGTAITGSCDLFDSWTRTVIDWKVVGARQLDQYRIHGPSERYRVQAHLYGLGYLLDPEPWGTPAHVAICFLPRDGELNKTHVWAEPWDAHVAARALNRLNQLWQRLHDHGIDAALEPTSPCDSPWCPWCKNNNQPTTLAGLISGR